VSETKLKKMLVAEDMSPWQAVKILDRSKGWLQVCDAIALAGYTIHGSNPTP